MSSLKDPENQLYFEYRDECVDFLDDLLKHKMFHRAKKITVDDKFLKSKKKKSKETEETDGDAGSKSDAATAKGTYALSFYRSQNVLGWSKVFVLDQKFIYVLWQSQTFCARQKDDLHSVKLFFVPAQKVFKRH